MKHVDLNEAHGSSPATPRRLQRVSRVGLVPIHVAGLPVGRRDVLPDQPQSGLHLGPMMAGMQNTPPECPNPPYPTASAIKSSSFRSSKLATVVIRSSLNWPNNDEGLSYSRHVLPRSSS